MNRVFISAATAICLATSASASTLQPLHENPVVLNGFYAIGMADILRKNCEDIDPRWIRAYNYLKSLEKYARNAGYNDDQIDELMDNKAEKELLRGRIIADLKARGAGPENPEGYCTVGREEIAKGSATGKLLRAK